MKTLLNRVVSVVLTLVVMLGVIIPTACVQATEAEKKEWEDPIPAERIIYDLKAENFHMPIEESGDGVVEDPDSPFGKAAHFSYAERVKLGSTVSTNSMRFVGQQALRLYVYGGDPKNIREIGAVSQSQLRANSDAGQYIMYHFEDINLFPTDAEYFLYMFECWGFQIHINKAQRAAIENQLVDIYLSLKVKGDIAATEGNTPEYFIDRLVIATAVEGAEVHEHELGECKSVNDFSHEAMCQIPGCGEVVTEDHKWDDGVVTKEATPEAAGIKTFTCSVCQGTRTKKLAYVEKTDTAEPAEKDEGQNPQQPVNPIVWVVVGVAAAAVIVIVLVVVLKLKKKGNKE